MRCWGSNGDGEISVPAGLARVNQLSAGGIHSCALLASGAVRCWGDTNFGLAVPAELAAG